MRNTEKNRKQTTVLVNWESQIYVDLIFWLGTQSLYQDDMEDVAKMKSFPYSVH